MSTIVRRLALVSSLLLIAVCGEGSDAPKLRAEIHPTSVRVRTAGPTEATLVARNTTELTARQVQVSHLDSPGVTIEIEPGTSQTIPPRGLFQWTLKIRQASAGILSEDVIFQVHYTLVDETGAQSSDVIFTKVTIDNRERMDPGQIVAVSAHSTLSELSDFRPGYIYLAVENIWNAPVKVTHVAVAERPDFMVLKRSRTDTTAVAVEASSILYPDSTLIPAGESVVFPVYVESGDQVRPGEHMLLFTVFFEWIVNGEIQTGSEVVEHNVKVKVFGEEEVLGAITSVTTFLLVPGFLMVVVSGMIWKLFVPGSTKDRFPFSLTTGTIVDPRFWVIVITLSLLMAWKVYSALSAAFLTIGRREFLYGYGFQDIIWMWLFSIAIGVAFSVLAAGVVFGHQKLAAWRKIVEFKKAIKKTDKPVAVLEKIIGQGFSKTRFNKATLIDSGKSGVLIESETPGRTTVWIAPRITIWWHKGADELFERFQHLEAKGTADLRDLTEIIGKGLTTGQGKGIKEIVWTKEDEYIDKPENVDKSRLKISTQEMSIFLHEWYS
jgi:hypothetical protein